MFSAKVVHCSHFGKPFLLSSKRVISALASKVSWCSTASVEVLALASPPC